MDKYQLIEKLIREGYIRRKEVAEAMLKVPREEFVPEELRPYAYEDRPLPIGRGQTISAPHMVAYMIEAAGVKRGDKVLEIGTGSGYNAAVLAEIVGPEGKVYTIERIRELAEKAKERLEKLGYGNRVKVFVGDGSKGLPQFAPFDKIIVTAAAKEIPMELVEQLKPGGVMVIPVEDWGGQVLLRVIKGKDGKVIVERLLPVMFVPLLSGTEE
ncbi:protein-L-isoaspartate O-methyltransferase [Ignicoccus islandicus DSM 13165]|uniref:Protein-L-isoaspartate O-methyltransferase n=1 Tax=Ignicoccus islandicus DSM 13165 TaxID=940295 RepID=A0A0U2U6R6_9CREN|nr:protein-L-isoaspartate(D-aspartate) O-methyltransferase [Ignicoccus islandicus]ALU11844.1 protein-L-isoaspartate O-methyltransferase [Ignicoccus islandicus DSM 13165]